MVDGMSERYGDLLTGSYDCVDRVVLNAYFSLGHTPGGCRTWWRRRHDGSDDERGNAHLMRMAGRSARRVRAWGHAHGVEVITTDASAFRFVTTYFVVRRRLVSRNRASIGDAHHSPTGLFHDVTHSSIVGMAGGIPLRNAPPA
ncbi:MAG: hypothetical protein ACYDH5_00030 [Acidimicrobiales bacterium]